mmetsp:Transcript_18844/g.32184  ORF Transcript_18844/g.32184 Transcript_18844/m.32184 type:complete len:91 (-) Transcript_18844:802-1074(-)|eukprot:CAMPEP_0119110574 /NCGR_PEP_ID=MMETSP1180-20130426/30554_1 /TAXON_ID=3052 ORGANISM="Chlamydomonas cf sp, Strain CCMP681" /NCGR_SAMPLE_ID=MMETSP1180 /ASSEMBLY_ACC=CAM_ASM_000741 /LENGTH=90 /DNA_ID=CAMNT_0007096985 /DNA_START=72 /DNA_END=344 /DNA_ORIENTATION=-
MAFVKKVIDHLLNQVLVEGLANSRWFQRFAVWSHGKMQNVNETAKDPSQVLESTAKYAEQSKQGLQKWHQEFLAEMKRLRDPPRGPDIKT